MKHTDDEPEVAITMSEKEWEQVFFALLVFEGFAKAAKIKVPEKRQAALTDTWWRTQLLLRALYKPGIVKTVTRKIGSTIGDDWPQGDKHEIHG